MIWINSLDQVYPVVDGGPVKERYVFFVWLPNIETCLHQLPAALEDAVPKAEGGGLKYVQISKYKCQIYKCTNINKHSVKYIKLRDAEKICTQNWKIKKSKHPNKTPTLWHKMASE